MRNIIMLIACFFVVSDIGDYYTMTYNKHILGACFLGIYACGRNRVFRGKALLPGIIASLSAFVVAGLLLVFDVYAHYYFYYYTVIPFIFIYLNYAAVKWQQWKAQGSPRKKLSFSLGLALVFLLCAWVQITPHTEKSAYLFILTVGMMFFLEQFSSQERKHMLYGLINGICLGSVIAQSYAWGFRHYQFGFERYTGYMDYTTFGGMNYMMFYIAWLSKYVIAVKQGASKKKRFAYYLVACFTLALLYLTGGRSPVVGSVAATAVLLFALHVKKFQLKYISLWIAKCAMIGVISISLFVPAYASIRYLPTIIGMPDHMDSLSNRIYSVATIVLKQSYLYDGEYNPYRILKEDEWDSPKYVSLPESFYHTFSRIIPGMQYYVKESFIGKAAYQAIEERFYYFYQEGMISKELYEMYQRIYGDIFLERNERIYLVSNSESVSVSSTSEALETLSENFDLRNEIQEYAWLTMNLLGHESGDFNYEDEITGQVYIHPHNIFLDMGYNFGIIGMLMLILIFAYTIVKYTMQYIRTKDGMYLFPVALTIAMSFYGLWEIGFRPQFSIMFFLLFFPMIYQKEE